MSTVAKAPRQNDIGRLANNFILVQGLRTALSRIDMIGTTTPKLVVRILNEEAWKEWTSTDDGTHHNHADFRQFIQAPWPDGCGAQLHVLERMIRGTDAWELYLDATRGTPGAPEGNNRNLDGCNQWSNRNIITVRPDDPPAIIPLSADVHRPKRDYARESKQGTSVSYSLRRLEKNRPDLFEKVRDGDLTPHAAMVIAGFVDKAITIPDDPAKAGRRLARHFRGERLRSLIDELCKHLPCEE